MKKLLVLLAVVLLGCGYAGYPYLTLQRIERAAMARDDGTINTLIDWPRVREGFKSDFQAVLLEQVISKGGKESGFGTLGTMLGSAMVDKMLDGIVGPEVLYKKFETREPTDKMPSEYMVGARFISPTIFQADFRPAPDKPLTITVTMEFAGLTWKVSRVSLPMRELMGTGFAPK